VGNEGTPTVTLLTVGVIAVMLLIVYRSPVTPTVRSFMTPSIAALLGRWFWWPVRVRQRPIPQVARPGFC
jgi:uncharacterized membrane protein YdfJ with MMPL/SSD domain